MSVRWGRHPWGIAAATVGSFVELGSADGAELGTRTQCHIKSSRLYSKYEARVSGIARSLMLAESKLES